MKIKTIIIFLLSAITLYSQDIDPMRQTFTLRTQQNVDLSNPTLNDFQQNVFLTGWHWNSFWAIDRAVGANQRDIFPWERDINRVRIINDSTYLFLKPWNYTHSGDPQLLNCRGFQYEPTLDKTDPNATSGEEVFGFKHILGRISEGELFIESNIPADEVILSDNWPDDQLTFYEASGDNKETIEKTYLNRTLYLTINLHRVGTDNTEDNTPIMRIELPYSYVTVNHNWGEWFEFGNSQVYFDSIPRATWTGENSNLLLRGRRLNLQQADRPNFFEITRAMLPPNEEKITISAFITLDDLEPLWLDPPLRDRKNRKLHRFPWAGVEVDEISSLKIKITNKGNLDYAIDYVRFETPNTRRMLWGEFDNPIEVDIQDCIDRYTNEPAPYNNPQLYQGRGIKLFRFNTNIEGGMQQWIGERYFQKLVGDPFTGETGPIYPLLYDKYVNTRDRWLGMFLNSVLFSVPFFDCTNWPFNNPDIWRTMGYAGGFRTTYLTGNPGSFQTSTLPQTLNSNYETWLNSGATPIQTRNEMSFEEYRSRRNCGYFSNFISFQAAYENMIYTRYYDPSAYGFLYNGKNWFHQCQSNDYWEFTEVDNHAYLGAGHGETHYTGESFRAINFNPIMMGAKGLFYDGAYDIFPFGKLFSDPYAQNNNKWNQFYPKLDDKTDPFAILNDARLSSDWIDWDNEFLQADVFNQWIEIYYPLI